ncbi:MAG: hypothetical protein Q8N51_15035, partial [Gammaproteobacteria bacterium]|nr:hypothetical protein [Gammaproteobacteria bacterium]
AAVLEALAAGGQWARVVELAAWCAGVDPFDVPVCLSRRRAQEALGDHAGLIDTLDRLTVLDPGQAEVYRVARARSLCALDRTAEARHQLLTLLEVFPEYREAQQLLLELHEAGEGRGHEDS